MNRFLKFLRVFLPIFVVVAGVYVSEVRTGGFRASKITYDFDYDDKYEIETISQEDISQAKDILNQNFVYLGRGRQCFVFESIDGNYVIKFLNHSNFKYPSILKTLAFLKPIEKIVKRKEAKIPLTFSSMKLSYEKLREEAKLIYVNLNKDIKLNQMVNITNKYGVSFQIDVDSTFFILQRKVNPFFSSLEKIYEKEAEEGLEKALNYYLALVSYRCLKNIADDDSNIRENMGFLNGIPVIIDTGRLYSDDHLLDKYSMFEEMNRSTKLLRTWLHTNHPDQVAFLDQKIDYYIYKYSH